MAGNTIGTLFRVTTWGESHGPFIGVVIDGCPSGLEISPEEIQFELDRRKPQSATGGTSRNEEDEIEIGSGIFEGKTTGTPITIIIRNKGQQPEDYEKLRDVFRPGHADYAYHLKYGIRDHRGGGRASGRETASRVIAGTIAKKLLEKTNTTIQGHTVQIGHIQTSTLNEEEIQKNPLRCGDSKAAQDMLELIKSMREEHDSIGGIIEILIKQPPAGLGEPVFDKLNADLAKAIFSIPAVKGVSFGKGFEVAAMRGSENNDPLFMNEGKINAKSNHAGGILGGISTGEDIVIRVAIKPPSSIGKPQQTITTSHQEAKITIEGRHDICIVPRVIPIAESMVAIILADHLLRQRSIEHF